MRVNGNIVLVEGCRIENLSLPYGADFPANGNLGELFSLAATELVGVPNGFYHHDGVKWQNIPTLEEVLALIEAIEVPAAESDVLSFKTINIVRTAIAASQAANNYWAIDGAAMVTGGSPITAAGLPMVWYDPADYPVGTKFRIQALINQNATASAATRTLTISLRKVLRPASAGGTNAMIYSADTVEIGPIAITSIAAGASYRLVSAEFEMPAVASAFAFHVNISGTVNASTTHIVTSLQAKI